MREREGGRQWCVCVCGGGCLSASSAHGEGGGVASFLEDVPLIETPLCTL